MQLRNAVAEKVSESKMYEYKCELDRVVDGDTVDVDIDLGFGVWLKKERVRIMGIDTPESRTSDKIEKIFGKAASARLKELIEEDCILCTTKDRSGEDERGKFGRVLGDFRLSDGRMVTKVLIEEGHAVDYYGGSKEELQEQHMKNRAFLIAGGIVTLPE
jgi:micrococcal nuclease|tara:strand:- start:133 stop:612 length:480 start_codon:yes stop_codon:yes gene_type:complete